MYSGGKAVIVTVGRFSSASLIGRAMAAIGKFFKSNDRNLLQPFVGKSVTDISGKTYPFETNPNTLYRLASAGGETFAPVAGSAAKVHIGEDWLTARPPDAISRPFRKSLLEICAALGQVSIIDQNYSLAPPDGDDAVIASRLALLKTFYIVGFRLADRRGRRSA